MSGSPSQIPAPVRACLALGSNIEPRALYLGGALAALNASTSIAVVAISSWIETEPLLPVDSSSRSAVARPGKYLNGACVVETSLTPADLLNRCLDLERSLGRDRSREGRWGPRTLDIDVLLYADRVCNEPGLVVPHPSMLERLFVLEPLAKIAADWIVPTTGQSVAEHLRALRAREGVP